MLISGVQTKRMIAIPTTTIQKTIQFYLSELFLTKVASTEFAHESSPILFQTVPPLLPTHTMSQPSPKLEKSTFSTLHLTFTPSSPLPPLLPPSPKLPSSLSIVTVEQKVTRSIGRNLSVLPLPLPDFSPVIFTPKSTSPLSPTLLSPLHRNHSSLTPIPLKISNGHRVNLPFSPLVQPIEVFVCGIRE